MDDEGEDERGIETDEGFAVTSDPSSLTGFALRGGGSILYAPRSGGDQSWGFIASALMDLSFRDGLSGEGCPEPCHRGGQGIAAGFVHGGCFGRDHRGPLRFDRCLLWGSFRYAGDETGGYTDVDAGGTFGFAPLCLLGGRLDHRDCRDCDRLLDPLYEGGSRGDVERKTTGLCCDGESLRVSNEADPDETYLTERDRLGPGCGNASVGDGGDVGSRLELFGVGGAASGRGVGEDDRRSEALHIDGVVVTHVSGVGDCDDGTGRELVRRLVKGQTRSEAAADLRGKLIRRGHGAGESFIGGRT